MKELVFNKKSWHYELATFGQRFIDEDTDICTYTRKVLGGIFMIIMMLAVLAAVWHLIVNAVLGIIFSIIYGTFLINAAGIVCLIMISVALLGLLVVWVTHWLGSVAEKRRHSKHDSFVGNSYRSWKEKYCARVKLVGGNDD